MKKDTLPCRKAQILDGYLFRTVRYFSTFLALSGLCFELGSLQSIPLRFADTKSSTNTLTVQKCPWKIEKFPLSDKILQLTSFG